MQELIQEAISAVQGAYLGTGPLAAIGLLLMYLIRIYRDENIQALMPKKAKWDFLPQYAKVALPFLVAFLGAGATALAGAVAPLSAAIAGLMAGLSAVGFHEISKFIGAVLPQAREVPKSLIDKAMELSLPKAKAKLDEIK